MKHVTTKASGERADSASASEGECAKPTRYYPAIVEHAKSGFGVAFPDFPGCVAMGASLDQALLNAEEALAFHIEGMIEDGESLPEPSALDAAPRDAEVAEVLRTLIHLDLPGQAKTISITRP